MAQLHQSTAPRRALDNPLVYVLVALAILAVGGGLFAYLMLTRSQPGGTGETLPARLVRVFEARQSSHQLAVTAYGTSRAAEVWTAISEVSGRAEQVNPLFEVGEVLAAGTLLVQIELTDYELARDRFQAEVDARQLAIKELDQNQANLRDILGLQQRQLELARAEYERQRQMYLKNVSPLSSVEAAENAYVAQQTAVQQTQQSLALMPVKRQQLEASLKAATVQLQQALRDLGRCQITLPMDARCASKSIEVNQIVAAGQGLGTFLALDAAEIVAMVETWKLVSLLRDAVEDPRALDLSTIAHDGSFWQRLRIPVEVRWTLGEHSVVWLGRLTRIGSSLDPATRTIPLIVEVRNPYRGIQPGVHPPLLPDAFCEITAYGAVQDNVVVIPRDALHDGCVYLLRPGPKSIESTPDPQQPRSDAKQPGDSPYLTGQLHVQPVDVLMLEEHLAVIQQGIHSGDLVILSDVPEVEVSADRFLAIQQMPLRGQLVANPVTPREKISVPDDLFLDDQQESQQGSAPAFPSGAPRGPLPTPEAGR